MVELTGNSRRHRRGKLAVLGEMAPSCCSASPWPGLLSICHLAGLDRAALGRPRTGAGLGGVAAGRAPAAVLLRVIPVAASMRRHGASRAATTAFLISTPQTGVDSIAATYALLGPVFAAFRPIAALISGMLGGVLVVCWAIEAGSAAAEEAAAPCTEPCCRGDGGGPPCCAPCATDSSLFPAMWAAAVAGRAHRRAPWPRWCQPHHWTPTWAAACLDPVLMAAGVPVYVCATASVPIAAGLDPHGRLAGRRLGLPDRRRGHQPGHLHHRLESAGPAHRLALPAAASPQRRRLAACCWTRCFHLRPTAAPHMADAPRSTRMSHGGWLSTFWRESRCWPCWPSPISRPGATELVRAQIHEPAIEPDASTTVRITMANAPRHAANRGLIRMTTSACPMISTGSATWMADARFPRLRRRPRQHLQRLPGPRRAAGADRRRAGPVRRSSWRNVAALCDPAASPTWSAITPSRTIRGALPRVMQAMPQATLLCDARCRTALANTTTFRAGRSRWSPTAQRSRWGGGRSSSWKRRWPTGPSRCSPTCPRRSCCFPWMSLASTTPPRERFDEEVPADVLFDEAKTYYANILMPYGGGRGGSLEKLSGVDSR